MVTAYSRLTAFEGKADELRAILTEMVERVIENEGPDATASYSLHTTDDPNTFVIWEDYATQEALDVHIVAEYILSNSEKALPLIEKNELHLHTKIVGRPAPLPASE